MYFQFKVFLVAAILSLTQIALSADSITIQEFADFQCGYCARGNNVMKEVKKNYPGKVQVKFRNYPLPSHPFALTAAKVYSAISIQCKSMADKFKDQVFDHQDQFNSEGESFLYKLAETLGADISKMKKDMEGEEVAKQITEDARLADSFGFKATPSFRIGNESVEGALPYEEIKKVIDRQLSK